MDIVKYDNEHLFEIDKAKNIIYENYYKKIRNKKTPEELVKTREGSQGKFYDYITRRAAMDWLDHNYPGWSMKFIKDKFDNISVAMVISIEIYDPVIKRKRIIQAWGEKEVIKKKDGGHAKIQYWKAAETDALKRCVMTLGGFNDVYTEGDFSEEIPEELNFYIDELLPKAIKYMDTETVVFQIKTLFSEGFNLEMIRAINEELDNIVEQSKKAK